MMKRTVAPAIVLVMVLAFSGIACSSKSDNAGKCPSQETIDSWGKELNVLDGDIDQVDFKEVKPKMEKVYNEIGSYLTGDLKAEFSEATKSMIKYFELLDGVDFNNPDSISDEKTKELESIDMESIEKTTDQVKEYFKTNCPDVNFSFGDDSSSDGASDGDTATTEAEASTPE